MVTTRDLAKLYGTETKRINEAVARNKEKFPERYCFKISEKECNSLKSHYATSKGRTRKGHRVFFHDRFIIIDRKVLYNCGSSFKDLGKKCFAINEMESFDTLNTLLEKIFSK